MVTCMGAMQIKGSWQGWRMPGAKHLLPLLAPGLTLRHRVSEADESAAGAGRMDVGTPSVQQHIAAVQQ